MVNDGPMSQCAKDCLNMKINHGPTSNCDKHCLSMKINNGKFWSTMFILEFICLNMKINHGKPLSTMFILGFIIFILGFVYLGFIILIPRV